MTLFKKIGKGIHSLWHFLCRNKIHIIPVLLWLSALSTATDKSVIWYQVLGPFVTCLFYYTLFLFPGFYAAWKKKYPNINPTGGDKK